MRQRYDLTRREVDVLRELVLTEDKQTVISERLSIKVKTLQDYVTRLYRKTGATTRAGLIVLYHENQNQE
jgi:DNA-binding CsgD family transcriptional regulator